MHGRDEQREPAAVRNLQHVRAEKCEVDRDEKRGHGKSGHRGPMPPAASHDIKQNGRDQHRGGDRDAVGGGEMARGSKAEHEPDAGKHQNPIHHRHVDLADDAR